MRLLLLFFLIVTKSFSQGYTSYFTGNTINITRNTEFGICLMGGATEHDNAIKWLLEKANGGDVVVLRASGSNGYNDYLYSQLGVPVNSVETLVISSAAGATSTYVLDKVANAEMIWIAGGNQWNYVSYFKNNVLEDLINNHINLKNAPIGGTSAGMAILGSHYFSAQNGSVTSAQALVNPYNSLATIGSNDFIQTPLLQNVITDTHFDNPIRKGRLTTFLARLKTDFSNDFKGIAANEYVAICIDLQGKARVFGDYPNYQEFAYFVQPNCAVNNTIEDCQSERPLTWNFGGEALKVYKVPGTMNGTNYFQIDNWQNNTGLGGSWENWSASNGVFTSVDGSAHSCVLANNDFNKNEISVAPNPFLDELNLKMPEKGSIIIYDNFGKTIFYQTEFSSNSIDTSMFYKGLYFIKITMDNGKVVIRKILKN